MAIVSFAAKLMLICDRLNMDRAALQTDLRKKHVARPKFTDKWFDMDRPDIHWDTRERLIDYLKAKQVPFTHACFAMEIDKFRELLGKPFDVVSVQVVTVPPRAVGMDRFTATYQLIRPHTFRSDQYILETIEIADESGGATCLMYSHNNVQDTKYLYEGKAHYSSRYCSSLVTRMHEHYPEQIAFRSLMLYAGQNALSDRLSGLMLRGVKGEVGSDQAAAVPFIALRSPEKQSLRKPDFVPGKMEGLFLLHDNGHVLVGVVDRTGAAKGLYAWCHSIFSTIKELETGIMYGSSMTMHTVAPDDLRRIETLNFESWRTCVDEFAAVNYQRKAA